jgi:hypothetical protein
MRLLLTGVTNKVAADKHEPIRLLLTSVTDEVAANELWRGIDESTRFCLN